MTKARSATEPRAQARGIVAHRRAFAPGRAALGALGLLAIGFLAIGQAPDTRERPTPDVRFAAYDVYVDSGKQPLGAWQVDVKAADGQNAGTVKIVGIEGGDAEVYKQPPVYDPRAMMRDRVIIGAYSTAADLPHGRTRVATIHVRLEGPADWQPEFDVKLDTAATSEGAVIAGEVTLEKGARP